jgi:subtilisin family serine protease
MPEGHSMKRSVRSRAILAGLVAPLIVLGLSTTSGGAQTPNAAERAFTATPLAPTERITGHKAPTSALAQTDPELLARDDAEPVNVMIKLDYDSVATYGGGVAGYEATSPLTTGEPIDGDAAEAAYEGYVAAEEAAFVTALDASVPGAEVGTRLRTVYGGVAAVIPANAVETVLAIDGVVAVQNDAPNQLLTDSSPEFVNAPPVYDHLGTTANAGQGVIYGNLDTGVWPEHPSFADQGNLPAPPPKATGPPRVCIFGDNPLTPANDPFVCQNKLIGGHPFLDTYLSNPARAAAEPFHTARDSNGHGTHTASTTAGNMVDDVSIVGGALPDIHGLAPGAWVMEYKVCGIIGCFPSDTSAAVGQAIRDGVDVINYSISGGTDPFTDATELAFLDAYAAGVFVSASAGNEGPGAGTANHLSPWTTAVAASTQARRWTSTVTVTAGADSIEIDGTGIRPDGVTTPTPVVLAENAPGYDDAFCDAAPPPGAFNGLVVGCRRSPGRVAKGFNVMQGGGVGMVLYNFPSDLFPEMSDTHWLPTSHIQDGASFLAFLAAHPGALATISPTAPMPYPSDVVVAFSSRGPAGLFIKPDVTAPGVQILAGDTPVVEGPSSGPGGELFQAIGGTSMSSPHVAGAGVLVRAVHPTWSPGQIRSALMTTAITDVVKEDYVTPADPFDFGAGRIDIGAASAAALTLDETAANFAALGGDPLEAIHLNIPSINAPVMPGRIETTRTFTNVSDRRQRFRVSTEAPAGSTITVRPQQFNPRPGESVELEITIESDAPTGVQQFGQIQLVSDATGDELHLPVAWIHMQGSVSLAQECTPSSIAQGASSTCTVAATNKSFDDQVVNLDTYTTRNLPIVATNGAAVVDRFHAQRHGVTLAGAVPGVPTMDDGELFGYIPLDAFGVTPNAIGDEDIINFDVPAYVYNGVTYTVLGVDSNGYLIADGGTSEDNNCCNLPTGPSPAPPNNMLAPFWTDLDGTAAPGIFIAVLTDGVNSWIVVEHRVNVFGTTSLRIFQVWIGINGVQDITFAYDPANRPGDPAGQDFLVGAENELGEGDVEALLPTTDKRITSTDPVPGDTLRYTVTVRGQQAGTGTVRTEMTSAAVPGVTVVEDTVAITPAPARATRPG